MFAALSWLLDLHPAPSSGSSTNDTASYNHSRSGSSSSSSGSTACDDASAPRAVPPTTFKDAQGEAVAELHVDPAATASVPPPLQGPRRDSRRENSLFADLHVQGSTYFSTVETRDETDYSASSPHTVPVWNLSTYTSDAVSITPLPSPMYGQAPTNPSAAFYSLAEHGTVVAAPPIMTGVGRTLWASDGVVLSACFPASGGAASNGNDAAGHGSVDNAKDGRAGARQKTRGGKGSTVPPIVVVEPRRTPVMAVHARPCTLSAPCPAPPSASHGHADGIGAVTAAAAAVTTCLPSVVEVAMVTPQSRILEWDQEVRERRALAGGGMDGGDDGDEVGGVGTLDPAVASTIEDASLAEDSTQRVQPSTAALLPPTPTDAYDEGIPLPSVPSAAAGVVQLHPSNPFLMSTAATTTTLPSSSVTRAAVAACGMHYHHAEDGTPAFSFTTAPEATQDGEDKGEDVVVLRQLSGFRKEAMDPNSNAFTFMEHALRQRTEELLKDDASTQQGSPAGSVAPWPTAADVPRLWGDLDVETVQLGDGLVTLTAMEAHAPRTPMQTAAKAAPPSRPVYNFS